MPLLQTDSNGGVIVTDWYTNPRDPNERMKVSVSILDQDLRADALRVTASRQVARNGGWIDAPVQAATVQKLEDVILTKARDLRRQACPARSDCLCRLSGRHSLPLPSPSHNAARPKRHALAIRRAAS
jgi:alpha-beta hydrolase superfamily lysophospholipase